MSLRLNDKQLEKIRQQERVFVEWYVEEIMQSYFPEMYFSLTDEGKREMIGNARRYALEHGMETAEAQGHFIGLMWDVGPNFYLFPGFKEVLARDDLQGMEKIELIFKPGTISRAQSAAAVAGADERYWRREALEASSNAGVQ